MEEKTESKYSKRLAFRKRLDGGRDNPVPIVLYNNYTPKARGSKYSNRFPIMPLPYEKSSEYGKYYRDVVSGGPRKMSVVSKTYDHFNMNYYDSDMRG